MTKSIVVEFSPRTPSWLAKPLMLVALLTLFVVYVGLRLAWVVIFIISLPFQLVEKARRPRRAFIRPGKKPLPSRITP